MTAPDRVMLFDVDAGRAATIAASLAPLGLTMVLCHRPAEGREALRRERPSVAVIVAAEGRGGAFAGLGQAARDLGIPTLAVVEPGTDHRALVERVREYDGWASLSSAAPEIAARVVGLLESAARRATPDQPTRPTSIDFRFLALVIHDLRTPLNVIGLTIPAIKMSALQRSAQLEEDLRFLVENARQIERMLSLLGDYCRLIEAESQVSGTEFDPRRFLADFLEDRQGRSGVEPNPVRLEVAESCPREVSLDLIRVQLALNHALANAIAAAGNSPVRIRSEGRPGRWVVEVIVEKAPPATVVAIDLRPEKFERLSGSEAERRGLDLSIVARVSELFGGSARLEIEPGRRSIVVLDWPDRLASP